MTIFEIQKKHKEDLQINKKVVPLRLNLRTENIRIKNGKS